MQDQGPDKAQKGTTRPGTGPHGGDTGRHGDQRERSVPPLVVAVALAVALMVAVVVALMWLPGWMVVLAAAAVLVALGIYGQRRDRPIVSRAVDLPTAYERPTAEQIEAALQALGVAALSTKGAASGSPPRSATPLPGGWCPSTSR